MKVCIYGAGSLGTVLGAYVAKSGEEIDLVNRNKAHVAALKEHGATITGTANFNVKVNAMLPEEMKEKYDIIFLMTKQLNNKEVVKIFGGRRRNMYDAKRSSGTQRVRNNRRRQDVRVCNRLGRANDRSRRQRTHVGTRRFGFRARRTQ